MVGWYERVSMKSGLGDRNKEGVLYIVHREVAVSMKSGLGDRNNTSAFSSAASARSRLDEVRSWRPEQFNETGIAR